MNFGGALLAKRSHAFGVVGGHMQLRLHQALDVEIFVEAGADRGVKQLFRQAERKGRRLGEIGRKRLGLGHQLVIFDDMVDEAQGQRLLGLDKAG